MKLVLAVMTLAAISIRLYGIDQPIVTFHATRHYRSAIIARACYYRATSGIAESSVRVADANRSLQPAGEPPVMEGLACAIYLAIGRENVAIPRALAASAWAAGVLPLYLLALRTSSVGGALIAAALYLFLPYGIVASRNFQPDALMTLCSLWALVALVRHHERPARARLYTAAASIAVATLVKPMSVFLTVPLLVSLGLARHKTRRLSAYRDVVVILVLSLIPAGLYYGHGAIFGTLARDQMRMRFVPDLLTSTFFWTGWLTQIRRVFTLPLFLVGLLGVALAPLFVGRVVLASLWVGYAAFAVAFTYHMPTHDYYHLPYIAAVALGIAAVISRLQPTIVERLPSRVVVGLVAAACVVIAALGLWRAWPRLEVPDAAAALARYREIGNLAEHDTKVLFLDPEYGYPLMYHSELAGDAWPNSDDLAADALANAAPLDAHARFTRDYADFAPRYFVATDLGSLEAQPDLQALLAERAVVVRKTAEYHVYKFVD